MILLGHLLSIPLVDCGVSACSALLQFTDDVVVWETAGDNRFGVAVPVSDAVGSGDSGSCDIPFVTMGRGDISPGDIGLGDIGCVAMKAAINLYLDVGFRCGDCS